MNEKRKLYREYREAELGIASWYFLKVQKKEKGGSPLVKEVPRSRRDR